MQRVRRLPSRTGPPISRGRGQPTASLSILGKQGRARGAQQYGDGCTPLKWYLCWHAVRPLFRASSSESNAVRRRRSLKLLVNFRMGGEMSLAMRRARARGAFPCECWLPGALTMSNGDHLAEVTYFPCTTGNITCSGTDHKRHVDFATRHVDVNANRNRSASPRSTTNFLMTSYTHVTEVVFLRCGQREDSYSCAHGRRPRKLTFIQRELTSWAITNTLVHCIKDTADLFDVLVSLTRRNLFDTSGKQRNLDPATLCYIPQQPDWIHSTLCITRSVGSPRLRTLSVRSVVPLKG
ncbi:hypothetical protein NEOLEDRAFT_1190642 [Neolentinus lepideus HHB14362 ss-1]|uniref:Uncharacterized protein n=1 Tax=Neolentinus lepideus HHB14362 ss-1 TaxID=1314782 RepID=A0A165MU28_9AGAM|nr:hypothetical protein NEOLEDRAFT_1190642 [Neolentinus lepideus HHB14362 ss-1]